MSETFWAAIIASLVGIGGTLLGVWLTQRHAAKLARDERAEARRGELRTLLADLITNAGMIVGSLLAGIGAMKFLEQQQLKPKDRLDALEDAIQAIQASAAALPRQMTEVVLLAGDKELRDLIEQMSKFFLTTGVGMTLGSVEMIAVGGASPEKVEQRTLEVYEFAALIGRIQTRSEALLRVEL